MALLYVFRGSLPSSLLPSASMSGSAVLKIMERLWKTATPAILICE